MVLLGYDQKLGLDAITAHSRITKATRLLRGKEPTRQVLVELKGDLERSIDLGNWGKYRLRTYIPEPLRCFKCQKYGHHQANCWAKAKCGVCSRPHSTEVCLRAHKDGTRNTVAKCPNFAKSHHAWSRACSARKQAAQKSLETATKQSDFVPAPPGTFVWGGKHNNAVKTCQSQAAVRRVDTPDINNAQELPELKKKGKIPQKVKAKNEGKAEKNTPSINTTGCNSLTICRDDLVSVIGSAIRATLSALNLNREDVNKASNAFNMVLESGLLNLTKQNRET